MTNYVSQVLDALRRTTPEQEEMAREIVSEPEEIAPVSIPIDLESILAERHSRYGTFMDNAVIAQRLKDVMENTVRWEDLAPDQKEALEIIASKISRMLTGDPDYSDSWIDIAGYARLVADRIEGHIR